MAPARIEVVTLADRPDLSRQAEAFQAGSAEQRTGFGWPRFEFESEAARCHWRRIINAFPAFQLAMIDDRDQVVATGHSIPFRWDGTVEGLPAGWDEVLSMGFAQRGERVDAISALAITVAPEQQSNGYSVVLLRAMKDNALRQGIHQMVAPVRPMLKSRYPLTPIDEYVTWRMADGRLFDPWLRAHLNLEAMLLRVAPRSLVIAGTVSEWERWAGMAFPVSGRYVVPGALSTVRIDRDRDQGEYLQPNVWMQHPL
jgi:hypothetical protein